MTMQQWMDHKDHMDMHIAWPATRGQIVEACKGEDVDHLFLRI